MQVRLYLACRTRETVTRVGPGVWGIPRLMLEVRCRAAPLRGGLLDITRLLSSSLFMVSNKISAFLNRCRACSRTQYRSRILTRHRQNTSTYEASLLAEECWLHLLPFSLSGNTRCMQLVGDLYPI